VIEALALDGGTPVRSTPLDYRRGARRLGELEQQAVASVVASQSLFRYYGPALQERVASFERDVERHRGTRRRAGRARSRPG
jgi:8-amino-3,8-dideoxy-alpha-D-manno-octulosonate transaminase